MASISWGAMLALVGIAGTLILSVPAEAPLADAGVLAVCLAFVTVGALVASRVPRNPIGWVFVIAGLFGAYGVLVDLLAQRTVAPARAVVWMAWLQQVTWSITYLGIAAIPILLFPDGKLPSPRWRWVVGVMVLAVALLAPVGALVPGPLVFLPAVANPLGVEALSHTWVGDGLQFAGAAAFLVSFPGAAAAMAVRFRRSRGEERLQLKWFAYAAAWAAAGIVTMFVVQLARAPSSGGLVGAVVVALALAGLLALPVATGIAILRYRLYDIDVVVNRTLVYGLLTVLLGAVYAAGVVLVPRLAGIGEGSDLAVAVSTLTVAALFAPLRHRVQRFVDRVFYRSRYDTDRTVAAFSARLRDEVDLDDLEHNLVAVVGTTLQPTAASMWLRPELREHP